MSNLRAISDPDVTVGSIAQLMLRMPPRHPEWTPDEDARLVQAYRDGERIDLVADELGRTHSAARSRADKIGLGGTHPLHGGWCTSPEWTADEDAILKAEYGKTKTADLAAKLNRSKGSVFNRAFSLGLKHGYHRKWSDDEIAVLRIAARRGICVADIASAMGRKPIAVHKFASKNGIKFDRSARSRLATPLSLAGFLALADPLTPTPPTRREAKAADRKEERVLAAQKCAAEAAERAARPSRRSKTFTNCADPSSPGDRRRDGAENRSQAPAAPSRTSRRSSSPCRTARVAAPGAGFPSNMPAPGVKEPPADRSVGWVERYAAPKDEWAYDPEAWKRVRAQRTMNKNGTSLNWFATSVTTRNGVANPGAAAKLAAAVMHEADAAEFRRTDPFEQAKSFLQRRGPVFSAAMRGGPADQFIISGRPGFHTRDQLIALAREKGWQGG